MQHDDVTEDGWLPLATAAERLGLSIHAARRRVHTGELVARRVRTRYGLAWQVRLDDEREGRASVAPESREASATVAEPAGVGALVALVREQQAQLLTAHEAAALWQGRAESLATQLAEARETIRALQAPPPPEPAPEPIPPAPTAAPWDARWQARATIAAAVLAVLAVATAWAR